MHDSAAFRPAPDHRHILMITNHGVHEWEVVPGLPDTGGQNVYVNQLTEALVAQGYRVTIVNRGGYPHPVSGNPQRGVCHHPRGQARIIYLEDGHPEFVRKEDMDDHLPRLAEDVVRKLQAEDDTVDLIISHYWDGCKLGTLFNDSRPAGTGPVPHVWIPHSLGAIKKRNMDPSVWASLRIDERIATERILLQQIDGAVATSSAIRESLRDDYGMTARYFLPPCVDPTRYRPLDLRAVEPLWDFLAEHSALPAGELKRRRIVTEISRTDKTKRKDVLIRAFAHTLREVPDALLILSIDPRRAALRSALLGLIEELDIQRQVVVLGSVWEQLPLIYNATSVYCTPSVMEGFGMSAQEAAATGKAVVSSDLVPFAREYLLGDDHVAVPFNGDGRPAEYQLGEAAITVPADRVDGFAAALIHLLTNEDLRRRMGDQALAITIPYFTWMNRSRDLMHDLGMTCGERTR